MHFSYLGLTTTTTTDNKTTAREPGNANENHLVLGSFLPVLSGCNPAERRTSLLLPRVDSSLLYKLKMEKKNSVHRQFFVGLGNISILYRIVI